MTDRLESAIRRAKTKLKECPFCGAVPEMEPWHGGGPEKVMVSCRRPACEVGPSVCGERPGIAVTLWNRRAP